MRAAAIRCQIRRMEVGDIPQVLEIERESFPTMWPQTVYKREVKNKMARYLVACDPAGEDEDGLEPKEASGEGGNVGSLLRRLLRRAPEPATRDVILGLVGVWLVMGEAHIVTIAVRREYRRQGIGEVLLVAAMDAAREANQDTITLEYRISNEAARNLYDKYGFTKVGVRAGYYTDNNEDAVLMTTPPLDSSDYRRLLAERIYELRERWGDGYPLAEASR